MSLVISLEIPDNWTEEQKAKAMQRIKEEFEKANFKTDRKPPYYENAESVYRDALGLRVIALPVENPKGEKVMGHYYQIGDDEQCLQILGFQNGSPLEVGLNGPTLECITAVLIHRLETLNAKFACEENVKALEHYKNALQELETRTRMRTERGVAGREVA